MILDIWFHQTLYVKYFTEIVFVSVQIGPVNRTIHYVLTIPLGLMIDHYVINMSIKSNNQCWLMNWLEYRWCWYLKSALRRHYVLATLWTWFLAHLLIDQWLNQTLFVRYYTRFIKGSYFNEPVNKIRHYALADSLT